MTRVYVTAKGKTHTFRSFSGYNKFVKKHEKQITRITIEDMFGRFTTFNRNSDGTFTEKKK